MASNLVDFVQKNGFSAKSIASHLFTAREKISYSLLEKRISRENGRLQEKIRCTSSVIGVDSGWVGAFMAVDLLSTWVRTCNGVVQ